MAPAGRNSKNTTTAAAIAEIPDTNVQLELIISKLTALESLPAKVAALEKLAPWEANRERETLEMKLNTSTPETVD
jgi:hypothetical protein